MAQSLRERFIYIFLFLSSLVSIFTTFGIVFFLLKESLAFFKEVSVVQFFTDSQWTPLFPSKHFGIWPLIAGTAMVTIGGAIVSLPLGLSIAIYLSEYASERIRRLLKPLLEILAGIPTVVYGYFALVFITPFLRFFFPQIDVFNAASASLAIGIMTLPMVASLSEDAMLAVPRSLREGAYALGATKLEVVTRVVIPTALSGIVAAFILALGRAMGETMIVAMAAGATPKLTLNPLESIQAMPGYIVQVSLGDTPFGSIEYLSIFAVGLILFVMSLGINLIAHFIARRRARWLI